ncbi:hypothetical protein ACWD01_16280 [Streptomyces sp. NPDC002835]
MIYGFLATGSGIIEAMPEILAAAFDVRISEVDVSDSSELDSRNWDALVTCEYDRLDGDLNWSLSVYIIDDLKNQFSEEQLALILSRGLKASVFFTWGDRIPWVRKVADPAGGLTLARVSELDPPHSGFRVTATEAAVSEFPDVPVINFPEVVRAFRIPTPVTDLAIPTGSTQEFEVIRDLFANWERLCIRMRNGWPPSGWYSVEMYKADLELRDRIETELRKVPTAGRSALEECLSVLDAQYREVSIEDSGNALSRALGEDVATMISRSWYWRRRPAALPWQ